MITIFAIPKPFINHPGIIQRNALRSWTMLHPGCEIILCGNAQGVKEAALEFDVKYIPDIDQNEYGTPLLNYAFKKVANIAKFHILCYVNADIILLNNLLDAIKRIPFKQYVAVGQRTNVDITTPLDFEKPNWCSQLVSFAKQNGQLDNVGAIDCFVFTPNGYLEKLPPFIVGRPAWDNWFITNARRRRVPVVDFTRVCTILHQKHDYNHVPFGTNLWNGPEAEYNREIIASLLGKSKQYGNVWDATHILTKRFVIPALGSKYLRQRWNTIVLFHPSLNPLNDKLDLIARPLVHIRNHLAKIYRWILNVLS